MHKGFNALGSLNRKISNQATACNTYKHQRWEYPRLGLGKQRQITYDVLRDCGLLFIYFRVSLQLWGVFTHKICETFRS